MGTKTVAALKQVDDDPAYAAARVKYVALQLRRDGLDREIMELASHRNQNRERLDAAAQAMIDGGDVATAIDERALETKRAALYRERSIVHRALELQAPVRDAAYQRASGAVRVSVADQHKAIGRRVASAMVELRSALTDDVALRVDLDNRGAGFGFPLQSIVFLRAGHADDPFLFVDRWLDEHAEYLAE